MDRRAFLRRATAVAGVAAIAPVAALLPAPLLVETVGFLAVDHDPALSGVLTHGEAYETAVAEYRRHVTEHARQHEQYLRRLAADRAFFA